MVMIGAVSPMARDMPTMAPVRMPGRAAGSRYIHTACHLSAPSPKAASRISSGMLRKRLARGDDDDRQDQQSQRHAGDQDGLAKLQGLHEQAECEQAVDDRRHAGEIGDVDLDDVC